MRDDRELTFTRGDVIETVGGELADVILVALATVAEAAVAARAGLRGLETDARSEVLPALMRPAFARWTPFGSPVRSVTG